MTDGLPAAGRVVSRAVTGAVAAAVAQDGPGLRAAVQDLAAADGHVVRHVLSGLVLRLVEQDHPRGLDADSVRELLADVLRDGSPWLPDLDAHAVVLVLGGALSVTEEDAPVAAWSALLVAAALVVTRLLDRRGLPLGPELTAAFGELRREQTVELP